ncbi:MAG: hypothetical protein WCP19_12485 [Chloroflexota bacterium]
MDHFDFCLTWSWEYDQDFVNLLSAACQARNITFLQVSRLNLPGILPSLTQSEISFSVFLDRTEFEPDFQPVFDWAKENACIRLNPKETADWAEDKATMHLELVSAGVNTPFTVILPPYHEQQYLPALDISHLGESFVIKPGYGGGGEGVLMNATSFQEVLNRRMEFPQRKYLLQKVINPHQLETNAAWFRIIYCDGNFYPCWWSPVTHIYTPVTEEEVLRFGLDPLRTITSQIASLSKLGFFSTEIAFTTDNQWVVIDYVNDQIDMRLKSQAVDGVPDTIVNSVCINLSAWIKRLIIAG